MSFGKTVVSFAKTHLTFGKTHLTFLKTHLTFGKTHLTFRKTHYGFGKTHYGFMKTHYGFMKTQTGFGEILEGFLAFQVVISILLPSFFGMLKGFLERICRFRNFVAMNTKLISRYNSFTSRIINRNSRFHKSLLLILLCILLFSHIGWANVAITAGTGGTNISADKAANATNPSYTTLLGKIYIGEALGTDFLPNQSNVSFTLAAPTNWAFNPGVGTIARTGHGSFSGTTSIVVTASLISVTFSTSADVTGLDSLIISNLQVQSSNGSFLPNAATINRSGGTATITGFTSSQNCASLSQVAGTIHHFVFNPDNNNNSNVSTPQRTGVAFSVSIYAKDQFGNNATTFAGAANLTVNGGTISPTNSGNFVAGAKTVSITLSPVGVGRIITATNVTKTGTSNSITVNSDGITPQGSLTGSTICSGNAGQLRWISASGTNPFTIVYTNGNSVSTATGIVSGTAFNVAMNPTSTTTYNLVAVTDANGNIRNTGFTSGSAAISVISRPTSVLSGTSTICRGSSATLNILFTGTAPFSFRVNGGSNIVATSNPQPFIVSPTVTTVYAVTNLNDANSTAISGTMTGNVTVIVNNYSTIAGAQLVASTTGVCNNGNKSDTLQQSY